jgi:2-keto-4-pentenoate hydratase
MSLSDAQVEAAARHLEAGFAAGLPLAAIPEDIRPASIEDSERIAARLRSDPGPLDGWKAGASSPAQMRDLGVSTPPTAPLPAGVLVESPADLDASAYYLPVMEAEVAFRMASDLPPRDQPYSVEEVSDAVAGAHIAIEAANFPFEGGPAAGMPSIIAAGFAVAYLVLGPEIEYWRERDLRALDVQLLLDGEVAATGLEGAARCDPLGVLVSMANDFSARGFGLEAGQVVTTGAAAAPTPAQPGQTVTVRFGDVGEVIARLV